MAGVREECFTGFGQVFLSPGNGYNGSLYHRIPQGDQHDADWQRARKYERRKYRYAEAGLHEPDGGGYLRYFISGIERFSDFGETLFDQYAQTAALAQQHKRFIAQIEPSHFTKRGERVTRRASEHQTILAKSRGREILCIQI